MGESSGKSRDLGFALLSGILALAIEFFVLVPAKIYETATGSGGLAKSAQLVIVTAYMMAGFVYGRKRGFGVDRSLAAVAPLLIMMLVVVITAEQLDLPWVIIGMLTAGLTPFTAHWLASYLGWKTAPARR